MKNSIAVIVAAFVFASCNQTATALKERIAGADSIAINYFNGGGTMDSVLAVKIIRDKKSIEELTGFITQGNPSAFEKNNYGYSGSVHFFKTDRVVQDVYFCINKERRQFVYSFNGKNLAAKLSDEAAAFLLPIKNK